jgi:hypothetical protein
VRRFRLISGLICRRGEAKARASQPTSNMEAPTQTSRRRSHLARPQLPPDAVHDVVAVVANRVLGAVAPLCHTSDRRRPISPISSPKATRKPTFPGAGRAVGLGRVENSAVEAPRFGVQLHRERAGGGAAISTRKQNTAGTTAEPQPTRQIGQASPNKASGSGGGGGGGGGGR